MSVLVDLYRREPARVNGAVAGLLVALVAWLGFDVDDAAVVSLVGLVLPIVAGELTRAKVTPTRTE